MADVPGKFYRATKVRTGVAPSSAGSIEGEVLPPVNPPGSSLNSVGLTMPSAFTVSNSPLTSNGTIGVAGAGTVGQYIRGDGSLADFPQTSGGGSSVSYYLNGSVDQGTIGGIAYKELSKVPILGAGTDFTINADGYIASFITDAGDPSLLEIPGGNWNFETYFSASSSGGTPTFYVELYKVSGTTATLIASSSSAPEFIAFGTNLTPYFSTLAVPTTTLALTDRLAVRYYVTHSGRTITLHTENNHLCQIVTTFTTGITALNGLTAQVQNFAVGTTGTDFNIASATATHTFNLPTASATNRGALSAADWSTFNAKQNALTLTTTGTSGAATLVGATLNIPQYQAAGTYITSVTASSPLASSGGTTPNITIQQASGSQSGFLSSTDWTTFNNKQNALTNPVTGTGTNNTLPKFTGTSSIGNSLFSDNGTNGAFGGANYSSGTNVRTFNITAPEYPGLVFWANNTVTGNIFSYTFTGNLILGADPTNVFNNSKIAFEVDGGEKFAIFNNGNVSISNSPNDNGFKLDVSGTGRFTSNLTAASFVRSGGTSSQYLMADGSVSTLSNPVTGTGTTNYLPKFTGTSTIGNSLVFDNGTNVGIGTNSPFNGGSINLDVNAGAGITSYIVARANNNAGTVELAFDTDSGYVSTKSNHPLRFRTNDVTRAIITTNGRLLIGTPPPVESTFQLDVNGTGRFSGNLSVIKSSGGSVFTLQSTATNGEAQIDLEGRNSSGTVRSATFKYDNSDIFRIGTSSNIAMRFETNDAEAMRIFSSRNVHIGSTPASDNGARLQVSGTASVGTLNVNTTTSGERINVNGAIAFQNSSSVQKFHLSYFNGGLNFTETGVADYRLFIKDGGNVGIGTPTPLNPLHIVSNSLSQLNIQALSGNTNAQINLEPSGTGIAIIGPANPVNLSFRTDASIKMTLTTSGRLLIGNPPPAESVYTLDVVGGARFTNTTRIDNGSLIITDTNLPQQSIFANYIPTNGNTFGLLRFGARFNSTTYGSGSHISVTAVGTWSSTNYGTNLSFGTVAQNSDVLNTRMTIFHNGNVGIGTPSPPARLSVQWDKSTAFAGSAVYDSQAFNASNHGGTLAFGGTFNSAGAYTEWSAIGGMKSNTTDGNVSGDINFYTRLNSSAMIERMKITSVGDVFIGCESDPNASTNGIGLYPNGEIDISRSSGTTCVFNRNTTNGQIVDFRYNNTQVGSISTNSNSLPSDLNFKKDIVDISIGLNLVNKLRPVHYRHKMDEDDEALSNGIIAQELEQALLDCGIEKNSLLMLQHKPNQKQGESQYWVDYTKMIPVLIKSIQELKQEIDTLKN